MSTFNKMRISYSKSMPPILPHLSRRVHCLHLQFLGFRISMVEPVVYARINIVKRRHGSVACRFGFRGWQNRRVYDDTALLSPGLWGKLVNDTLEGSLWDIC